ncbi:inactive protein RESTRICTED TEV MOVEMENT 2-like [Rhododendron vialii]|uniref:inactive protein RESTRICTED TEV MOVEMENT 2-like n=1 Tax=Rhododendron vialii TaxID=182163 RepID=UPI00266009A5|nr:inactive protein RESTRICTED TEV MOVEMENT 2-like [Rhododendron vialii]XP_058204294.1 inactive protein RESTRICTED TEV MOVEMENT 2-like [Rhododendron vialii]
MKPPTNTAAKGAATEPAPADAKAGDAMPTYDNFEPFCGWQREEGKETLVVHVPEFKRNQIKVHLINRGTLRISGERPIDGMKRSRFAKYIKVPKDCNPNEITAKFTNAGLLHIIMPKKTSVELETKQDHPIQVVAEQQGQAQDQNVQPKTKRIQVQVAEESRKVFSVAKQTIIRDQKVVMGVALGVVVAVVVALGAFAAYKYTRPAPNV